MDNNQEQIVKQRLGNPCNGGNRVYIEDKALEAIGLSQGKAYRTEVDAINHVITIIPSMIGNIVIPRIKKDKVIPVVDKKGVSNALSECTSIKITFIKSGDSGRVIIQGYKDAGTIARENSEQTKRPLTCATFCGGSGISSLFAEKSNFLEIAACEFNPKEGSESRFSDIYSINHPNSIMFNIPMEKFDVNDLPYCDVWAFTIDCTDWSSLSSTKSSEDYQTMHLFMYLMKIFWERKPELRPKAILVENVPGFEKVAGNSLRLCFKEEGYFVTMAKLNSLDYGSRSKRERFFLVASAYEGFTFPDATGRQETPIIEDGIITLETLDWITPEDNATLKYYVDRNNSIMHNHKIRSYDICKDSYVGTVTKTSHSMKPENLIRHPEKPNTFAMINKEEHLKYLHDIDKEYYLGESVKSIVECVGQSVDGKTYMAIMKQLYNFLSGKIFSNTEKKEVQETVFKTQIVNTTFGEQMCFAI